LHDRATETAFPVVVKIIALLSALGLVTMELLRMSGGWSGSLITLVWAVSALLMTLVGLQRRLTYLRQLGLAIFALTIAKVFLVDLADLRGLQRIAAFFGVGVLLLILSYAYQRVAPMFLKEEESKDA
jgi:uncharacterized membrane protein